MTRVVTVPAGLTLRAKMRASPRHWQYWVYSDGKGGVWEALEGEPPHRCLTSLDWRGYVDAWVHDRGWEHELLSSCPRRSRA